MDKGYLKVNEAVEYSSKSRSTIYRWFKKGLPKIEANGTLVKKSDLDEYMDNRKRRQLV